MTAKPRVVFDPANPPEQVTELRRSVDDTVEFLTRLNHIMTRARSVDTDAVRATAKLMTFKAVAIAALADALDEHGAGASHTTGRDAA